jgi:hypothetical protein
MLMKKGSLDTQNVTVSIFANEQANEVFQAAKDLNVQASWLVPIDIVVSPNYQNNIPAGKRILLVQRDFECCISRNG